jgi:hypothetical protein
VIVVTARGTAAFREARDAGCDAFFCKPIDPYSLDDVIRAVIPAGPAMPLEPDVEAPRVVKRCACGRAYTATQWRELRLCGYMGGAHDDAHYEIRNCVCGSTIGVKAPWANERLVRH